MHVCLLVDTVSLIRQDMFSGVFCSNLKYFD